MPEIRSTMSYLSRIANSMPCTHWLGWPWFSHSLTCRPISAPAFFSRSMMPFRNGLVLEFGIDNCFLAVGARLGVECFAGRLEHRLLACKPPVFPWPWPNRPMQHPPCTGKLPAATSEPLRTEIPTICLIISFPFAVARPYQRT